MPMKPFCSLVYIMKPTIFLISKHWWKWSALLHLVFLLESKICHCCVSCSRPSSLCTPGGYTGFTVHEVRWLLGDIFKPWKFDFCWRSPCPRTPQVAWKGLQFYVLLLIFFVKVQTNTLLSRVFGRQLISSNAS